MGAWNAAQNCSALNRIALYLLKRDRTVKIGIHGKRPQTAWGHNSLLRLLGVENQDAFSLSFTRSAYISGRRSR